MAFDLTTGGPLDIKAFDFNPQKKRIRAKALLSRDKLLFCV